MSNNGKGDAPRPFSVDQETFSTNWERAFGKKKEDSEYTGSFYTNWELAFGKMNFGKKKDNCEYSGLPNVTSYEQSEVDHVSSKGN